jgi:hypothetical protein
VLRNDTHEVQHRLVYLGHIGSYKLHSRFHERSDEGDVVNPKKLLVRLRLAYTSRLILQLQ